MLLKGAVAHALLLMLAPLQRPQELEVLRPKFTPRTDRSFSSRRKAVISPTHS
jgi:hypothetical protein